jgi:hypothetical protein
LLDETQPEHAEPHCSRGRRMKPSEPSQYGLLGRVIGVQQVSEIRIYLCTDNTPAGEKILVRKSHQIRGYTSTQFVPFRTGMISLLTVP